MENAAVEVNRRVPVEVLGGIPLVALGILVKPPHIGRVNFIIPLIDRLGIARDSVAAGGVPVVGHVSLLMSSKGIRITRIGFRSD
jgi:hypothetical protein